MTGSQYWGSYNFMQADTDIVKLSWWLSGKEPACNAGDVGSVPGEGNVNPLQYTCLGNPMDRGTWWATVHGVAQESDTTQQLKQQ